jgi:TFIIF-interacting CTD phosphatase-like protein
MQMTLILDLDETLVHSSIKPLANYDWRVYVPAAGESHKIFNRA